MTEAYPLKWPEGWPKTAAENRDVGHHFRSGPARSLPTFDSGRKDVLEELRKMGIKTCVISSSIDVRQDGVPRPHIDPNRHTIREPGVAIYFSRKGRPVVIAQDAYTTPGVNLRSLALALDAMRTLERHGGGTLAGKAFDGFTALPPPAGMKPKRPWWEVLRYPADEEERELLSVAEIEARFRTLAKKLHPDAGGSDDVMAELNAARAEAIAALDGDPA